MTKKIGYSKTYPILNIGVWEKIWIEEEVPEEADTRKVLYDLKKQVENFHYESNKADEKKSEENKPVKKDTSEADKKTEKEIAELKTTLEAINSYDQALEVLQASPYKYSIELKQIVMSKSKS